MPGGDRRTRGLLDEPGRGVHEDVGTDELLDGVQDRGVSSERMHPRQQDVRAGPVARIRRIGRERSADGPFERLEFPAVVSRLLARERCDGRQESVPRVALHLG